MLMKKDEKIIFDFSQVQKEKKISNYKLAKITGKSPSFIGELKKPGANPTLSTIKDIVKALDCNISDIIKVIKKDQ